MTFITSNGIRYPNDPNAYADIIQFFREMAEDVDSKFVSNIASLPVMAGSLTALSYISSNGGKSQSSTVLQTGSEASNAFVVYDDNQRLDGSDGRRLKITGANGTDVGIGARADTDKLNRISMTAKTLDFNGAVTINGTLNVTGNKTIRKGYETNMSLAANKWAGGPGNLGNWTAVPSAPYFNFTAPPSLAVTVGFGAMLPTGSTTTQVTYRIREGVDPASGGAVVVDVHPAGWNSTNQPPPHCIAANGHSNAGTEFSSVYTPFLLTSGTNSTQVVGLKKGMTYNVQAFYMNKNAEIQVMYRMYFIVTPDL